MLFPPTRTDVVVIGAGQAGLATGYFLRRAGFRPETGFVILDAAPGPGGAWQHRWPSLLLGTTHHVHDLPGLPLPRERETAPAADVVSAYFADYEREYQLPVHRPIRVRSVRPDDDHRLLVQTTAGSWSARALVSATGTWERPFWPAYPGRETFRGRQLHTADYRGAAEFAGKHVVVVGGGTSAVQLLTEIAEVASTTWVTRRPPTFRPGPFTAELGRAAVARVEAAVRSGRPPASVVSATGLHLTAAVQAGIDAGVLHRRPMFERITPDGVAWADRTTLRADVILWCTGFRPATDHLAPLRLREPGGGIRLDGTRVVRDPRVQLVGYGPSASTIGANRAGRAAVRDIRRLLTREPVAA